VEDAQDEYIKIGLFELIDAFQRILKKIPSDERMEFTTDKISVKDKISQIVDMSATFDQLFTDSPTKSDVIVTFLAILEMVKLTLIRLVQHVQSGIIRIFYL
jgi:segregation and condensation protein A